MRERKRERERERAIGNWRGKGGRHDEEGEDKRSDGREHHSSAQPIRLMHGLEIRV